PKKTCSRPQVAIIREGSARFPAVFVQKACKPVQDALPAPTLFSSLGKQRAWTETRFRQGSCSSRWWVTRDHERVSDKIRVAEGLQQGQGRTGRRQSQELCLLEHFRSLFQIQAVR